MSNITTPEIILIITTIGSVVVNVVAAVANGWGRRATNRHVADVKTELVARDDKASDKLEHIKELANGTLATLRAELQLARAEIVALKQALLAAQGRRRTDGPSAAP